MRDRALVRHFIRGLLDHDLISPHADRHQVLTVGLATLLSGSLFVTVLLGRYVGMPFQSPGRTALLAADDRLFYTAISTIVLALVAVAQWPALAVDARDASVLGPLPIPYWRIVLAKLAAAAAFGGAFALALNGIPSLLHPVLMVGQLPVDWSVVPPLVAAHAVATMGAGAFGFLAVLAVREVLRALLGDRWFGKVSAVVQAGLVLGLVSLFLLLPILITDARDRLRASERLLPISIPLFAFAGLQERLAGSTIEHLPHRPLPARVARLEAEAMAIYRAQRPVLHEIGRTAVSGLALVTVTAFTAYAWNSRRLPAPVVATARRRRGAIRLVPAWIARQLIARRPLTQAGFFFTLQVLARSAPHRVALAVALAIGVAITTMILRGLEAGPARDVAATPVGWLMIQTLLLATLLGGIRHAVRVPAELRGNWIFRLTFSGDERRYLAGVKRAALIGGAVPLLLVLLPLHAFVLGLETALIHAAWGALLAFALIEGGMLGFRRIAFASAYVPASQVNPLTLLPLPIALGIAYGLAWIERSALSAGHFVALFAAAGTVVLGLSGLDAWQRRARFPIDLDEGPAPPTQRFDLSG